MIDNDEWLKVFADDFWRALQNAKIEWNVKNFENGKKEPNKTKAITVGSMFRVEEGSRIRSEQEFIEDRRGVLGVRKVPRRTLIPGNSEQNIDLAPKSNTKPGEIKKKTKHRLEMQKKVRKMTEPRGQPGVIFDNPNDEWLTSIEAAALLKISIGSLMNMCSNGALPYYKLERRNRYRLSDLNTLLFRTKRGDTDAN